MWVSSIFHAVGSSPNFDWFQVVAWGRVGPALRPILTLSLFSAKRVAELLGAFAGVEVKQGVGTIESRGDEGGPLGVGDFRAAELGG